MRADYRISCSSEKYEFALVWAICSVIVYPVGLPLYYFYILYCAKADVMSRHQPPPSDSLAKIRQTTLRPLRPLYDAYKPDMWYFELVDIVHRLFLTGVLVVIKQGSVFQVLVGFLVIIFFKKVYEHYQPYQDKIVAQVKEVAIWQIYAIMFMALLIRLEYVNPTDPTTSLLMALVVFAQVIPELLLAGSRWVVESLQWPLRRGSTTVEMITANPIATSLQGEEGGKIVAAADMPEEALAPSMVERSNSIDPSDGALGADIDLSASERGMSEV